MSEFPQNLSQTTNNHRFRRYLNLKAYSSFEEWNPDKEVARSAELLYGHIENMELYPGLMAECTKPPMPGSGVCPGQTTGRGILDDAVSLVRGDRFLSYDFNSNTLTQWGAALLAERAPGAYGGLLPKLIFNAFPGEFTGTSSYAILPFYTPEAAQGILKGNKVLAKYNTAKPDNGRDIVGISTVAGCKQVFADSSFTTVASDNDTYHVEKSAALHKALVEPDFEKSVSSFFSTAIKRLIVNNSLSFVKGRRSIDIIRDVTNIAPIIWLADRFALPLKTMDHPYGVLSIYETFTAYLAVYLYQNANFFPVHEWTLREAAAGGTATLKPIFETHINTQSGVTEKVVDWLAKGSAYQVGPTADRLYHALIDSKLPTGDLSNECLRIGAPVAGFLTEQAALLVDLYLSPGYETYKARIVELATGDAAASEAELQRFVFEGMRLAPAVPGALRVATKDTVITDGEHQVSVSKGHTILVATSKAGLDPAVFPDPTKINPHRKLEDYAVLSQGLHNCFGDKLVGSALAATLREVFKLKGVRKAKGKLGNLSVVKYEVGVSGVKVPYYLDSSSKESPIPTSMTIEYDA
jgi:Cytochrome P450/Animal haem peroxidase